MAFCENCIHYDICQLDYNLIPEHLTFFPNNEDCKQFKNKADVVKVKHGYWIDKPSGRYLHIASWCSVCGNKSGIGGIESNRHKPYCPNCGAKMDGTPKERGAEKPKATCLNCKHLMFSDMYGECNKQLRIVNSSDTCEMYEEGKDESNAN